MNRTKYIFLVLTILATTFFTVSCSKEDQFIPVPNTIEFEQNLSSYEIYQGDYKDLIPAEDVLLVELSSPLFSNYAKKQRLIKLPPGTQMLENGNGVPIFPEGTILVKTFYYFNDETNEELGRLIIETRLLIKSAGQWNVASYVWNDSQSDATLFKDGLDTQVNWVNSSGTNQTIAYHVPSQEECTSCHQLNETVVPIGPSLRNLNIDVTRDSETINQLQHLQSLGMINPFDIGQTSEIPNYKDASLSIEERGRAYLDLNCASCHNPSGWSESIEKGYDFRYETPLENTKILDRKEQIIEVMENERMPYLGTTTLDQEGFDLIVQYINSL